jgi:hypothetical protein
MSMIAETIRDLVAPVVMISANGLICLALYNRLATMVTRLRLFHKERFDVHAALADAAHSLHLDRKSLQHRAENLEEQCTAITRRARLVRNALAMMLLGVIGMLSCSLVLGLANLMSGLSMVGLTLFMGSIVCMMAGIGFALAELASSLDMLDVESQSLESLDQPDAVEDAKQAA